MWYRIFLLILILLPANYVTSGGAEPAAADVAAVSSLDCRLIYTEMQLENIINYTAFEQAFCGSRTIERPNRDILTLIDFSKPSTEKRLYVLDLRQRKLLFSSHVAHGRNSGENYATSFSNVNGSYQSSLGFYVTGNTYQGKNGYSLILEGLEKGINDRARERAIVIHGAAYADPTVAEASGRLGRSFGCPALPQALNGPIINTIKNGTLLFIYANDKNYLSHSPILSRKEGDHDERRNSPA